MAAGNSHKSKMATLERLLARIGALRARWSARALSNAFPALSEPNDDGVAIGLHGGGACRGNEGVVGCSHDTAPAQPRRLWVTLLRLLWLCATLCAVTCVVALALRDKPTGPSFPDATLAFSRIGHGRIAEVRLQDSQTPEGFDAGAYEIGLQPKGVKLLNKKENKAVQVEWIYFGSSRAGDSYEFKATGPSGVSRYELVIVANLPIELLKDADIVVTIVGSNAK